MSSRRQEMAQRAGHSTLIGIFINGTLALVKGVAGYFGTSYALMADAVESLSDVIGSVIVWLGLRVAAAPPSEKYPYGRGRAEPLAGTLVALMLFLAAVSIAVESVHEIKTPHHAPAPFTLGVLLIVIFVKEALFRFVFRVGESVQSIAVKGDAWHHRSDAITSLAAFIGISAALLGGPGYESADDWAALFASAIIAINGYNLLRPALSELIDRAPDGGIDQQIREIAQSVEGVLGTHKCQVRKLGFDYFVDLDILCDPDATIRRGHDLAHDVGQAIHRELPIITKVLVHVEPADDFGRRNLSVPAGDSSGKMG